MERKKTPVARILCLNLVSVIVFLLGACALQPGAEQAVKVPRGVMLANALRGNVVKISGQNHGFGFIVGEKYGQLFIVTANHVVREDLPGDPAQVNVEFFEPRGESFQAVLLQTSDKLNDIAVLRVPKPQEVTWQRNVINPDGPRQFYKVWFVGLEGDWYVQINAGDINEIDQNRHFKIDGLNVQSGTSGAPVIAESGIVGMIIQDQTSGVSRGVSITVIQDLVKNIWRHPWDLNALGDYDEITAGVVLPPAPDESETSNWLWVVLGLLGAVALGGDSGGGESTGTLTVTAPGP